MSELSKLTSADKKLLGLVDTNQGVMVNKKRLIEIKQFQRKEKDNPQNVEIKKVKVQDMIRENCNRNDEEKGIY